VLFHFSCSNVMSRSSGKHRCLTIQEVLGSYLGPQTYSYVRGFRDSSQLLQANNAVVCIFTQATTGFLCNRGDHLDHRWELQFRRKLRQQPWIIYVK
jgi:hypothetical protein